MNRIVLNTSLWGGVTLLSFLSFMLVMVGANDEPYLTYDRDDLLGQVVAGTAVLTLWCCFAFATVVLVFTKRISAKWLFVLIWVVVCCFYLMQCPFGYISDLEQFILHVKS